MAAGDPNSSEWESERREFAADERETLADQREQLADVREVEADDRDDRADAREEALDELERQLESRKRELGNATQPYPERLEAAEQRLGAARLRRNASRQRTERSVERQEAGRSRKRSAPPRDLRARLLAREFADLAVTLFSVASVEEALERLTATAVAVLPGCDAASVTLSDGTRHWTPVATDDVAVRFDAAQYGLGHGPCLEALQTPLVVAADGNWDRWPGLGPAVADLSVTTVMSCGLFALSRDGGPGGALNLYGRKDNFDVASQELALVLAAHGAVALETQRERTRATTVESQLQDALMSRDVIGQAKGILMARQGLSAEQAFDVLRRGSQRLNVKLRELAGQLTESVLDPAQPRVPHQLPHALNDILDRAALLPPDRLPALAESVARDNGVRTTRVWLVDYAQRQLVPFHGPDSEAIHVEGTVAGRAFTLSQTIEIPGADGVTLWVPLSEGSDRLGVVQFEVDRLDDERRATLDTTALLLASELVTRGQYTDAMVLTRRTDDIPLASELLWGTLAPQTFGTDQVTVAVALEPAYGVAGDGYDYAYNEGVVHAAVFDAIGHDIEASIIGNLAIGAYRHARRRRRDLAETGTIIDRIIHERFDEEKYATGLLAELDVSTGVFRWINFGHPSPMLIRHDRVVGPLDSHRHVPLGLADLIELTAAPPNQVNLEPGDRLLLYTDGLVEARTATRRSFGVERLQDFLDRALASGLVGSEVVRRLAHAVVDHHGGSLNDDATTLMIHWHP